MRAPPLWTEGEGPQKKKKPVQRTDGASDDARACIQSKK